MSKARTRSPAPKKKAPRAPKKKSDPEAAPAKDIYCQCCQDPDPRATEHTPTICEPCAHRTTYAGRLAIRRLAGIEREAVKVRKLLGKLIGQAATIIEDLDSLYENTKDPDLKH